MTPILLDGPSTVELGVFLLIGLLGGAHCLGMCGPLVTIYADRLRSSTGDPSGGIGPAELRQHALFNLGRTASYAAIGGLVGLLGGVVFDTSEAIVPVGTAVRGVSGVAVGLLIVTVGLHYLSGRTGEPVFLPGGLFPRVSRFLTTRVDAWVGGPRIVGLGLIHGLLPCPLLYPAFLYAFAQGSAVTGALGLGALGLGTFPTLFLYGTMLSRVGAGTRARVHRFLGVAFLVLGWVALGHGLTLLGLSVPTIPIPIYQPL